MYTFVDRHVPEDALSALGRYCQACAHIEEQILRLRADVRGLDAEDTKDGEQIVPLRTGYGKQLVDVFAEDVGRLDPGLREDAHKLCERMRSGLNFRKLAVHGVWRAVAGGAEFRVQLLGAPAQNGQPGTMQPEIVTWRDLRFAAEDASEIAIRLQKLAERQKARGDGRLDIEPLRPRHSQDA